MPTEDEDDEDGRDESPSERADRNWRDVLQELRISQTGTQIIAGFLLTLPFQQRFHSLTPLQLGWYLALVVLAALTTGVGLAPVSLHRALFRRHRKQRTVRIGDGLLRVMLVLISLLSAGVTGFIFSVVATLTTGIIAGAGVLLALFVLLLVVPSVVRRRVTRM